jgi:hypothetical protein
MSHAASRVSMSALLQQKPIHYSLGDWREVLIDGTKKTERCVPAKTRLAFDLESKGGICSLTLREHLTLVTDN